MPTVKDDQRPGTGLLEDLRALDLRMHISLDSPARENHRTSSNSTLKVLALENMLSYAPILV